MHPGRMQWLASHSGRVRPCDPEPHLWPHRLTLHPCFQNPTSSTPQGTNAHALLEGVPSACVPSALMASSTSLGTAGAALMAWQPARTWAMPPPSQLVDRLLHASASAGRASFHVQLSGPAAGAWLQQHVLLGAALAPTSALLEVAAATADILTSGSVSARSNSAAVLALMHVVLPAALVLGEAGAVSCSVQLATGLVEVGSQDGTQHHTTHLYGSLTTLSAAAAPPAGSGVRAAAAAARHAAAVVASLFGGRHPLLAGASTGSAVGGVDATPLPGADAGLILHPCLLESALQLEALSGAPVAGPSEEGEAAAHVLKLPARMLCVRLGAPAAAGSQLMATAASAPAPSGAHAAPPGSNLTSVWLAAAGSSSSSGGCCHILEAEFRPLGAGAAALAAAAADQAAAAAATAAAAAAAAVMMPVMEVDELQRLVAGAVEGVLGTAVAGDEPLMAAGLDSLGAVELRSSLGNHLGVTLPTTLLYDYQSVNALVGYLYMQQQEQQAAVAAAAAGLEAQEAQARLRQQQPAGGAAGGTGTQQQQPSALLKLLRPAPPSRPLFLAAPGVANAQSAYFAFAAFLAWSDQPIYVLDKVGLPRRVCEVVCMRVYKGGAMGRAGAPCGDASTYAKRDWRRLPAAWTTPHSRSTNLAPTGQ